LTKAQAAERVRKLRALADPSRGGSPAERATAKAKADKLVAEHGIDERESAPRRSRRAPVETPSGVMSPFDLFTDFESPQYTFDRKTGKATGACRVVYWRNEWNWHIVVG
jgi:Protein of unknown function (DUF2786)